MSLIIQVMHKKLYNNYTEYLLDVVGDLFAIKYGPDSFAVLLEGELSSVVS